jgi:aryl-alcohol dehydrogenase-like predicted oxidoreductase
MKFRRLGRTELMVSEISLGTVEIGLDYGIGPDGEARRPPESEAARLLHRALDLGVNFIDTAPAYGESEAIIGRALKGRRQDFVICSKVLSHADQPHGALWEKVTASVEASLRALDTEVIDIMMIHSASSGVLARGSRAPNDSLRQVRLPADRLQRARPASRTACIARCGEKRHRDCGALGSAQRCFDDAPPLSAW